MDQAPIEEAPAATASAVVPIPTPISNLATMPPTASEISNDDKISGTTITTINPVSPNPPAPSVSAVNTRPTARKEPKVPNARMLKELASLAPWQWDPKIKDHPPGSSALRDFKQVENMFREAFDPEKENPEDAAQRHVAPQHRRRVPSARLMAALGEADVNQATDKAKARSAAALAARTPTPEASDDREDDREDGAPPSATPTAAAAEGGATTPARGKSAASTPGGKAMLDHTSMRTPATVGAAGIVSPSPSKQVATPATVDHPTTTTRSVGPTSASRSVKRGRKRANPEAGSPSATELLTTAAHPLSAAHARHPSATTVTTAAPADRVERMLAAELEREKERERLSLATEAAAAAAPVETASGLVTPASVGEAWKAARAPPTKMTHKMTSRAHVLTNAWNDSSAVRGYLNATAWWRPPSAGVPRTDPLRWMPPMLPVAVGMGEKNAAAHTELLKACSILRELDARQGWIYP